MPKDTAAEEIFRLNMTAVAVLNEHFLVILSRR